MTEVELDSAHPKPQSEATIPRSESGIRLLKTLLFVLIFHAVELVVAVLIVFQLGFVLITQRDAGQRTRTFAGSVIAYAREILEYVTYNREAAPFPFGDLPSGEKS